MSMKTDQIYKDLSNVIDKYVKVAPKPAHRNLTYAEGCSWLHWHSCGFKCNRCACFLMYQSGIFPNDYLKGSSPRVKDLLKLKTYLNKVVSGKANAVYALSDFSGNVISKHATEKELDIAYRNFLKEQNK